MNIKFTARKTTLKEDFKALAEKKLAKLDKMFESDANAELTVTVEKNREKVEITIKSSGIFFRAESTTEDMFESLDNVINMITRQIHKHKTRLSKRSHQGNLLEFLEQSFALPTIEEDPYKIVRTKNFIVKPMDVEEAILQMNMVGHKFYMFRNQNTNEINVVYFRNDGTYGLLEPSND